MNKMNHFIFALTLCLIFLPPSLLNLSLAIVFSFLFGVAIDYDHDFDLKDPWYRKRTWVQEPFGLIFIGLPLALVLSRLDDIFFPLILVPYVSHILLDYLCIFETFPLAPFSSFKKREGLGIFIPNSERWLKRVRRKKLKGIPENYFLPFNFLLLFAVILLKFM